MKKYGQAEYACHLLEKFVQEKLAELTAEQKERKLNWFPCNQQLYMV